MVGYVDKPVLKQCDPKTLPISYLSMGVYVDKPVWKERYPKTFPRIDIYQWLINKSGKIDILKLSIYQ